MTHRTMSLIDGRKAAAAYLLAYDIVAYALAVVAMAIAFLLARCFALGHGGDRGRAVWTRRLEWCAMMREMCRGRCGAPRKIVIGRAWVEMKREWDEE